MFVVAAALTGGAILRAAGTVFAGWGPDVPKTEEEPQEEDEQFETLQPHDRTPLVMIVPMVALMVGAVVVGLVPGATDAIEHAAAHFRDRAAYAATALQGAHPVFADTS